jgi:hypothetical protein
MKKLNQIAIILFTILLSFSCSNDDDSKSEKSINVYTAANLIPEGSQGISKVFKNGSEVFKTLNSDQSPYFEDMFVSGTDVYVVGRTVYSPARSSNRGGPPNAARLWKNGQMSTISTSEYGLGGKTSIVVNGSNVYIAFNEYNSAYKSVAKIRVNGTTSSLDLPAQTTSSVVESISESNGDVYSVGAAYKSNGSIDFIIWKNKLIDKLMTDTRSVSKIISSNGIQYILGTNLNGKITIWKKEGATISTLISLNSVLSEYPKSFAISGTDTYIVGESEVNGKYAATIWINGVKTILTDGMLNSNASSVSISGNDVYVAGYITDSNNNDTPTVWRNGKEDTSFKFGNFGSVSTIFTAN